MSTQIQRRRGTTTEHSTFTGAAGEITIDSTKNTVVVHDGSTTGGFPLAKESAVPSNIQDLDNVYSAMSPTDGQVLTFDTTNGWQAESIPTINTLNDISNVTITSASSGEFLKWDGAAWVNASIPTINTLNDISNVTITSATTGDLIKWDGAAWVNFSSTLNDIGNVTITSATTGEYLQWNGSAWVNAAVEAFDTQTQTTTATTQVTLASYNATTYGGIKAVITAYDSSATERSITELLITHDGTTAVATEYAQINTATALATFDVDLSGGNVRILGTPASTNSTAFTVKAITL
jgi:hypothetical protein